KMNAHGADMVEELIRIVADLKQDDGIRAVIVTGAGPAFCAGADLAYPFLGLTNTAEIRRFMNRAHTVPLGFQAMEKPVVAAINGPAIGAGLSLALGCDIRIASEKARFGSAFTAVGVHPDNGATYFLPRLVGLGRAMELMLTNRIIDAQEAERIGLVNMVVPPEQLEPTVKELARRLAQGAPVALALTKNSLNQSLGQDLDTMLETESKAQSICYLTEDCKEGVEAFLGKRRPVFKGR
ncbi:MAG: enoyl-CoA hydratase-related protein, partial [Chloroflexota bacterium]